MSVYVMHWVGFEFSCCDDVSTFDFDFVPVAKALAVADVADLATSQIIMMMRWAAMPHSGGRE